MSTTIFIVDRENKNNYSALLMGRKTLPDAKVQIASRVAPQIKSAIDAVAIAEKRTASQVIEILLGESPRVKAKIRENGHKKASK